MTKKEKLPIDFVLDKFVENLRKEGKKSADQYRQVINAFEVDGAFVPKSTKKEEIIKANVSKNFLVLVPKYIKINDGEVCDKNEAYDLNKVITWVKDYKNQYDWEGNGKKSYKSYINSFLKFIEDVCNPDNKDKYKDIFDACDNEYFSSSDLAILNDDEGDIYLHNKLATKFKSRLRCQDRTSGDKIWLPLRFIAKIYSKDKKDYDANHEEKKENQFSNWLNTLVDDIYIHYLEKEKVEKVRFGGETGKSEVHLRLAKQRKKGHAATEYDVYVRWIDNNSKVIERRVLTPTGRGNEKKEMVVSGIQAIAIDHVKPIDQTLRDLEGKLETLKIVSDYYKELCENDQLKEGNAISNLLKKYENFVEKLTNDLNNIHDDSILRLMDLKLNTQKSNGSTFKKIVKNGAKYYGIIEEDIIADDILNRENSRVVLYQELNNEMRCNGKLKIADKILDKDEVTIKQDLIGILNCI